MGFFRIDFGPDIIIEIIVVICPNKNKIFFI